MSFLCIISSNSSRRSFEVEGNITIDLRILKNKKNTNSDKKIHSSMNLFKDFDLLFDYPKYEKFPPKATIKP